MKVVVEIGVTWEVHLPIFKLIYLFILVFIRADAYFWNIGYERGESQLMDKSTLVTSQPEAGVSIWILEFHTNHDFPIH